MAWAPWSYRPLARATSSRYEPEVSAEIGADAWPVPAVELAPPDGVRLSTNTTVTTITTMTAKVIQMMTGDRRDSVAGRLGSRYSSLARAAARGRGPRARVREPPTASPRARRWCARRGAARGEARRRSRHRWRTETGPDRPRTRGRTWPLERQTRTLDRTCSPPTAYWTHRQATRARRRTLRTGRHSPTVQCAAGGIDAQSPLVDSPW